MFNVTRRKSDSAVQQQQQQQQLQQHNQHHHNQSHHQPSQQQQQQQTPNYNLIKEKPKFKRSVSIARLFGNAYSTSPHMSRQKNIDAGGGGGGSTVKARILFKNRHHNNANVANKLKIERFKNRSESQIDRMASSDCTDSSCEPEHLPIEDFCDEKDLSARAIRTISKGLSLFWRRSYSVEISTPDPEYKVFYLGNVLTGWAKGTYGYLLFFFIFILSGSQFRSNFNGFLRTNSKQISSPMNDDGIPKSSTLISDFMIHFRELSCSIDCS